MEAWSGAYPLHMQMAQNVILISRINLWHRLFKHENCFYRAGPRNVGRGRGWGAWNHFGAWLSNDLIVE